MCLTFTKRGHSGRWKWYHWIGRQHKIISRKWDRFRVPYHLRLVYLLLNIARDLSKFCLQHVCILPALDYNGSSPRWSLFWGDVTRIFDGWKIKSWGPVSSNGTSRIGVCHATSLCSTTDVRWQLPAFAGRWCSIDHYLLQAGPTAANLQQRRAAAGWDTDRRTSSSCIDPARILRKQCH